MVLIIIDARWYTRAEVQSVLNHATGTRFGSTEYKKMAESNEERNNRQNNTMTEEIKIEGPPFKLPPVTAIAGVLIKDWADGKLRFPRDGDGATKSLQRGHL